MSITIAAFERSPDGGKGLRARTSRYHVAVLLAFCLQGSLTA